MFRVDAYTPMDTLQRLTEDVWIVDGPLIRFGIPWPKLPFPTRMCIVRLPDRSLFVHSPTPLNPSLKRQVESLGSVRWLIAPNRLHYSWIPEWKREFASAHVYLAPGVREHAKRDLEFQSFDLNADEGYAWDEHIGTLPVRGDYLTEMVFFHRQTRTLVLTDLIENFEPHKLSLPMRLVTRWARVQDPDGQMALDLRRTFSAHKAELRGAVSRMLAWNPIRIVLAHGRCYNRGGEQELRRAFRWLRAE
jgi:hypothetical protein